MNIPEPVEQPTEGVGIKAILSYLERVETQPPYKYPQPKRRKKSQ